MEKGICLEFSDEKVSAVAPPKIIESTLEFGFSDFVLSDHDFPKKPHIYQHLTFSPETYFYYIKLVTPNCVQEKVFYLQCKDSLNGFFGLIPEKVCPTALDQLISTFRLSTHFAHHRNNRLDFFLMGSKRDLFTFDLACNEELIDAVFVTNPGIVSLVEDLEPWKEYPSIGEIHRHLKSGFLDPVRELMITQKNSLDAYPSELRERLILELFTKREINWKYS